MCTYQSRYHTVIFSKSYIVIKIRLYHCIPCNKILKPRTHLNVFFVWNIFLTRNKIFLTLSALQLNHRAASSKYKTCIHKLRIGHFKKNYQYLVVKLSAFMRRTILETNTMLDCIELRRRTKMIGRLHYFTDQIKLLLITDGTHM